MRRVRLFFLFLLVLLVLKAEEINRIIAKVNEEVITSQDLENYCKLLKYKNPQIQIDEKLKKEILNTLIENKLILSLAKREKVKVPQYWIKEELKKIISSYPSREAFYQTLAKEGLNITLLKERLKEQYLIQWTVEKYVRSKIKITPYEVTQFYYANKEKFTKAPSYLLWIGKWKKKEEAEKIYEKLKNNPEIDKESCGLTHIQVEENELKEEIKKIVVEMKERELVQKEINGFFYLIYLEKKIPSRKLSLEEVKDEIYSLLEEKKFEELFKKWIKDLKKKALIKIYE